LFHFIRKEIKWIIIIKNLTSHKILSIILLARMTLYANGVIEECQCVLEK
jgi:hypothetical protein